MHWQHYEFAIANDAFNCQKLHPLSHITLNSVKPEKWKDDDDDDDDDDDRNSWITKD